MPYNGVSIVIKLSSRSGLVSFVARVSADHVRCGYSARSASCGHTVTVLLVMAISSVQTVNLMMT